MSDHITNDLSALIDGELTSAEADRVRAHLAECAPCRATEAELRATAKAVRAMPQVRMPGRVEIPEVAPQRSRILRLVSMPAALAGGGITAVAAAAAIVLLLHPAGSPQTTAGADAAVVAPTSGKPVAGVAEPAATNGPDIRTATPACGTRLSYANASQGPPAAFGVTATASADGNHIAIATTSARVDPGQTILVYARQSDGSTAVAVPCVTLLVGDMASNTTLIPAPAPAPGGAAGGPISTMSVSGVPLETLTVPGSLAPGTTITLIASGTGPSGAPIEATLTLTVS